jgi:molybdopterin-guanine dinucleotide biosynthesis protein A
LTGKKEITGIVLAGGKSSRMGGEKGLKLLDGKPMIAYALEALAPWCTEILISSNSHVYDHLGCRVVPDISTNSGPMGGIYSCMLQSQSEEENTQVSPPSNKDTEINKDWFFVLSCDVPRITSEIVAHIISLSEDADITVPWHGGEHYEPLCAVYSRRLLPLMESYIKAGNFKIPDLIKQVNTRRILILDDPVLKEADFYNVNTRRELHELEKVMSDSEPTTSKIDLPHLPHVLMIAGTGRNVGKTTLACRLITQTAKKFAVTAVKISPHMHQQEEPGEVLAETNDYLLLRERGSNSTKDSGRMLAAGATEVFYLQLRHRNLTTEFLKFLQHLPSSQPVIIESGALLELAQPGLFVLVKNKNGPAEKPGLDSLGHPPDVVLNFENNEFDFDPGRISFTGEKWMIR